MVEGVLIVLAMPKQLKHLLIVLAMPKQLKHPQPQCLFVVNSNTAAGGLQAMLASIYENLFSRVINGSYFNPL